MRTGRYIFDDFSVDCSNEKATDAVKLFAKNFDKEECPSPIVIYGKMGTGKTHLLRASENLIRSNHQQKNILYVTAEQYFEELICAILKGEERNFRNKYIKSDVLIMDDLQFISGMSATREEFSHMLDEAYDNGVAILLSMDCEINNSIFAGKICSKLSRGLMIKIGANEG